MEILLKMAYNKTDCSEYQQNWVMFLDWITIFTNSALCRGNKQKHGEKKKLTKKIMPLVLQSASVERVGVSCMQYFLY